MDRPISSSSSSDLGIVDFEFYTPKLYVEQSELETYDGASQGKYTIGLGQQQMSVASDLEDVNSVCLTVTKRLLRRNPAVTARRIGRLEVGTESQIDKSKSVKSNLLRLFASKTTGGDEDDDDDNVLDAEGVDCVNACFGGTQALFNALNWLESSACRGRLALVVMGDIAVYDAGPARCTGGAAALALLLGPDASIVFDAGRRALAMRHSYDFYKPLALHNEYSLFDGASSIRSYMTSVDTCYRRYKKLAAAESADSAPLQLASFSYVFFHSPYTRLAEKSLARMHLADQRCLAENGPLQPYKRQRLSDLIGDRDCERACLAAARPTFLKLTDASLALARRCGNTYTTSVYCGLISVLAQTSDVSSLHDRSCLLFSYGSGSCAAMFSLRLRARQANHATQLAGMCAVAERELRRLDDRRRLTPADFTDLLDERQTLFRAAPATPRRRPGPDTLWPDTYYLTHIDDMHRRHYELYQGQTTDQ